MSESNPQLKAALAGDLQAFQSLFVAFQDQLRSYLYRLLANRADAEDLTHDTFIRAFDKLHTYQGQSSLKTWVFRIGTNLAYNYLQKRKRWSEDVATQAKELVLNDPTLAQSIQHVRQNSPWGQYDIKEHIDTCFTCIAKTLPIENQVALILKDIYDFSVKEIMLILDRSEGVVKYRLQLARTTLTEIFDRRCALVNKNGACHQCSELNGWLNPKRNQQADLMQIKLVKEAQQQHKAQLFRLRTQLVKAIDPLRAEGQEMQEILMRCNRKAMEER